jgi:sporulation protein YlmC with PRC-barrel domain
MSHLATDLLGCQVCSESGTRLGRVWEVRLRRKDVDLQLVALMVGKQALVARLGLQNSPRRGGRKSGLAIGAREIPWEEVVRIYPCRITVRNHPQRNDL